MEKLTITEALKKGYTHYGFIGEINSYRYSLKNMNELHFLSDNIRILNKESFHPVSITAKDISNILATHIESLHIEEKGGNSTNVFNEIYNLDFTEAENKIDEALSKIDLYRCTNIKLIPDETTPSVKLPINNFPLIGKRYT